MAVKYDWPAVIEEACQLVPQFNSLKALSKHMQIPRRSLSDIIRGTIDVREDEGVFEALLSHAKATSVDEFKISLEQQVRFWKTRAVGLEKRVGDREWFLDALKEIVSVLQTEPVVIPKPTKENKGKSKHTAMLLLSDIHYGAKSEGLGVFPIYNSEIAKQSINEIFERALALLWKMSSYMQIENVIVNLAGDLVEHNFLRRGHRGQVDKHVARQVVEIARILAPNIKMLAGEFPNVYVTGVPGNHGRADPTPGAGDPTESFDWLTFKFLEILLANQSNIETDFPECWYSLVRVYNYLTFTMHGEDIRSWAGNIPWYGFSRAIKNIGSMLTSISKRELELLDRETMFSLEEFMDILKIPDMVIVGHFHSPINYEEAGVNAVANNSLIGATRYGVKRLHKMTKPSQKLLFFHPEQGFIFEMPVFVRNVPQPKPTERVVLQVGDRS